MSSPTRKKGQQVPEQIRRVYEYQDDEGNVYWSFTKHIMTVSPPKRLVLQSRIGTHLVNFLAQLRQLGRGFENSGVE